MLQSMFYKIPQGGKGLFVGHRVIEILQPPRVVRKLTLHKFHYLLSRLIWTEGARRLDLRRSLPPENPSIFLVEIPFSSHRILTLHQDIVIPSHFPVESFQKKRFPALGKCFEVINARHKMAIRPHLKLAFQAFGRLLNAFKDAIVTRPNTDEPLRPRLVYPPIYFPSEAAAILGIVELYVVNGVAAVFQIVGKVPHG